MASRPHGGRDLTVGPIGKTLLAFALPTLISSILQSLNGTVNAIWNTAFDLGWGVGSIAVGALVGAFGYGPAFTVTAVAVALVAVRACRPTRVRR